MKWKHMTSVAQFDFENFILRHLTLPKGEKDDGFDHDELENGAIGNQQFTGGEVEEEESVERQTDGDVVDDGRVQVAARHTEKKGEVLVRDLNVK